MVTQTQLPALQAEQPVTEEMQRLLLRGQEGDLTALPELQKLLDKRRELWEKAGDLAQHAEMTILTMISGKDLFGKEAIKRKLAELKAELAGPSPTPLEKLLV